MEHNKCETCGAGEGRCGLTINGECMNCYKTRSTGEVCIDARLSRTDEEIQITMAILDEYPRCLNCDDNGCEYCESLDEANDRVSPITFEDVFGGESNEGHISHLI